MQIIQTSRSAFLSLCNVPFRFRPHLERDSSKPSQNLLRSQPPIILPVLTFRQGNTVALLESGASSLAGSARLLESAKMTVHQCRDVLIVSSISFALRDMATSRASEHSA